ncbi:glycosyltransferase family 4 protein [Sulfurimonas sp.]|uniref:glycosyltransferase family 4 protein n=1 Tax=Sulfurimonas sp. TaxID=2022749 RepID=UPI00262E070E|nr:MraY family glycosyltransferase [Sulfurimonas sp.]
MLYSFTILFLLLLFVTYVGIRLFIKNAEKFGLVDVPNHRSAHKEPVARGAGIVFGAFFLIALTITCAFVFPELHMHYAYLALLIVYGAGVYDDFADISSRKKFMFIIIAAVIVYYNGFRVETLGTYFGYEFSLGYMALPFTIFAIVGFTNALNLTDGLDGLAGSISVIILASLVYVGYQHSDAFLISTSLLLISVLVAFLLLNWYPAKVFMGDSGSLFLGFVIALLSIYALKYINPTSALFLAAIPLLDTLVVMRRRKQRKQSLFVADKNHLHHILLKFKRDKIFTVSSLLKLQVLFSLIFIQVYNKSDIVNLALFALLFSIFFNLFDPRMQYRKKPKRREKKK